MRFLILPNHVALLTIVGSVLAVHATACSGTSGGATNAGGGKGTLYVNGEIHASIYSFDIATGQTTKLVAGADPFITPEGTILCRNTTNKALGEYSADGTTFRTIVKENIDKPFDVTYDDHFKNPQLSPDGRLVAYEGQFSYTFDIYVVDRQSGALVAAVNPPQVGVGYERPTWTPDNLLVVSGGTQNPGIYISDATFKNYTRIDQNLANPREPAVSRDGKRIAFVLNDHAYTMAIDGSGVKQVTTSSDKESFPSWSPDGTSLLVHTSTSLLVVSLDGANVVDLHDKNDQFMTFSVTLEDQVAWR